MYWELPDVQAGFRKGTRDQTVNICWIIKKQANLRKTSTSASLSMLKPLTVWITINWKILEEMGIPALPASWGTCMSQEAMEPDMEQWTGSILGKEYVKAIYCYPAYLISMQNTSWETLGWKKHKLESRLLGELSITDMQMTPHLWQKVKN